MAAIDPAFQAAPVLGGTSYNPIEFARRLNLEKFQLQKRQQEQQAADTAAGLDKLMVNVKGWEDQAGFKEITDKQQQIENTFMDLSRKGINIISPKTPQDMMALKALTDAHNQLKQTVDTWESQKQIYDIYQKAIQQDAALPVEDQKIDRVATMANIQNVLKTKSIEDRANLLQNLVVTKPEIGDVHKYVKDNIDMITKPAKVQTAYTDPETGQIDTSLREVVTPQIQKQQVVDLRKLYTTAPSNIKQGVKNARQQDPNNDPMLTDEDYFVSMYNPPFKQQMIQNIKSDRSGGIAFNFGGVQTKIAPGVHNQNAVQYGGKIFDDRYDFSLNKPVNINSNGGEQFVTTPDAVKGKTGWQPFKVSGNIKATIMGVDLKTNRLICKAEADEDLPWVEKGGIFTIPIGNVPEALKFPIIKDDGKPGTLKDVLSSQATTPQKKVYNPKTGKFEDALIPSVIKKQGKLDNL